MAAHRFSLRLCQKLEVRSSCAKDLWPEEVPWWEEVWSTKRVVLSVQKRQLGKKRCFWLLIVFHQHSPAIVSGSPTEMIELNSIHKQKLVFNGKKTRKTRAIRQEKTDLTPHKSVVLPKIWGLRLFERQTSVYLTCGYLYNKTKKNTQPN